ncbi:hypothetical protein ASE74_10340 [Pedobacter sp. Leaf216]|uniref:hypothetical protein n=1 Tax=Pedobacter sp. Leaf216 TaxID=1735684 RepID=UPI0006FD707A|nr:hypothetical protein [Pedobacter sp. Leaf216]KQM65254.1 hypothetical protein ASE74_10340 [Pedobacter sp. Leaf216]
MKKLPFIFLSLIIISLKSNSQTLPDFFPPKNYKMVTQTKGDLDKDGIEELVIVFDTDKADGENGFKRMLYICKQINGKNKLWKSNSSILKSSKDCGFCIDAGVNLSVKIKNNTLITEQSFNHNSRHYSTWKNVYRYQNADWFLIGSTYDDYDTCDFDYKYDINFSTKQVSVAYTYGDCDDGTKIPKDSFYNFKYPFKALPKMDGFIPGQIELKIPANGKYFYY